MSDTKPKYIILFRCDNQKDRDALLKAISRHTTITWNNDTIVSNIEVDEKKFTVNVNKSSIKTPQRLRL